MEEKRCPWCGLPESEVGVVTPGMTAKQFIDRYAPMWDNFCPSWRFTLLEILRDYERQGSCTPGRLFSRPDSVAWLERFIDMLHSGELVTERGASKVDELPSAR